MLVRGERIESSRGGKEVHAADVARAVELLLQVDAKLITGQSFNCYDRYVAEEQVARIARLPNDLVLIQDLRSLLSESEAALLAAAEGGRS